MVSCNICVASVARNKMQTSFPEARSNGLIRNADYIENVFRQSFINQYIEKFAAVHFVCVMEEKSKTVTWLFLLIKE